MRLSDPRTALLAVVAALACDDPSHPPALRVNARSGSLVDLSRTSWETCRPAAPGTVGGLAVSVLWREDHGDGGNVAFYATAFDGPDCTGTELLADVATGFAWNMGDKTVGFAGAPPPGVDGPVLGTKIYVNLGVSGRGNDSYWLDDTASPRVLYTGDPGATRDEEGYPEALLEGGEQER